MKDTEQLSVRVPPGTKDRLRRLSDQNETLVSTLLRAIAALEKTDKPERMDLRVTRLECRVKALEQDARDTPYQMTLQQMSDALELAVITLRDS